jgi:hypothetical protein
MSLSNLHGVIRRRVLVNYRVDPQVMSRHLPAPFRPRLQSGHAIAGICLIRLEALRPAWLPRFCGWSSENAAHRVAVEWEDPSGATQTGVFIPRRDTNSRLNHCAGGRLFPGEHHLADFDVNDASSRLGIRMRSRDGRVSVDFRAYESSFHSDTVCFRRLADASAFFQGGNVSYSATSDPARLDGMELHLEKWQVLPLSVEYVASSYFDDEAHFPKGTATFDHALLMRDVPHEWRRLGEMKVPGT